MAKISDLTVNIGLTVSWDTAQRCCQILTLFLTDNPEKTVEVYEFGCGDNLERQVCISMKQSEEV